VTVVSSSTVATAANFDLSRLAVRWTNVGWDWDGVRHDGRVADTLPPSLVEEREKVVGGAGHRKINNDVLVNAREVFLKSVLLLLECIPDRTVDGIASGAWDISTTEGEANIGALVADSSVLVEGLASKRKLEDV